MPGEKRKIPPEGALSPPNRKKHKRSKHSDDSHSEFKIVTVSMCVTIPPMFCQAPRKGVEEMLDSMVMRYIPNLQGVVLAHSNLHFMSPTADFLINSPFTRCDVTFNATVWSPQIGSKLSGTVNICSPDHVALLVHKTFNVSIPRHHIPAEVYEFEYGAAENDPEYGASAALGTEGDGTTNAPSDPNHPHETGRWLYKSTGKPLGSKGKVEFTVIGLTIANQMLSLTGSIQPDPFSPHHIVKPAVLVSNLKRRESFRSANEREEEDEVAAFLTDPPDALDDYDEDIEMVPNEPVPDDSKKERAKKPRKDTSNMTEEQLAAKAERKRKRKEAKALAKAQGIPDRAKR